MGLKQNVKESQKLCQCEKVRMKKSVQHWKKLYHVLFCFLDVVSVKKKRKEVTSVQNFFGLPLL